MQTLMNSDLNFVVSRIPKDIRELIKNHDLILGGGFIRNTISRDKINDIDLFGSNKVKLKSIAQELAFKKKR